MTTHFWHWYWFWWLLAVLVTWAPAEAFSIWLRHKKHLANDQTWTLSDTIRDWSSEFRWLSPVAIAATVGLLWHLFGQVNLPG